MARNKSNYNNTVSKDGSLTPHLYGSVAKRVRDYCKQQDIGITKFVEDCVIERLDALEREALNSMPKEMLIEMILANKGV